MKKLLTILFISAVAIGCNNNYNSDDLVNSSELIPTNLSNSEHIPLSYYPEQIDTFINDEVLKLSNGKSNERLITEVFHPYSEKTTLSYQNTTRTDSTYEGINVDSSIYETHAVIVIDNVIEYWIFILDEDFKCLSKSKMTEDYEKKEE